MIDATAVLACARQFLFVREATGNKNTGRWVEALQRIGGTERLQPWCACYVSTVLGIVYSGNPPLSYTASCDVMLAEASAQGMLVERPQPGDLFFVMRTPTDAEHVGFVTTADATTFRDISGNTNNDGGRDGYGVMERLAPRAPRSIAGKYVFARYLTSPSSAQKP